MQGVTPAVAFAAPLAMARPQAEVSAQTASAEAVQAATVKYAEPSEEQTVQGEHGDVPPRPQVLPLTHASCSTRAPAALVALAAECADANVDADAAA